MRSFHDRHRLSQGLLLVRLLEESGVTMTEVLAAADEIAAHERAMADKVDAGDDSQGARSTG